MTDRKDSARGWSVLIPQEKVEAQLSEIARVRWIRPTTTTGNAPMQHLRDGSRFRANRRAGMDA